MAYINFDGITLNCDKVNYCKKLSTSTFGVYFDNGSNTVFTYNASKDGAHGSLDAKLNNLVGLLNSCSNNMDVDIVEEGGATNLDGLSDVIVTNPTNAQILKFNGTNWVNGDVEAGGATNLDGLTDVNITNPTNAQVLKFNGTNWVNGDVEAGGATNLDGLTDVNITNPTNTQVLKFDGTNWINGNVEAGSATNLDGLTDVNVTNPTNAQILKFDGTNWVNDTMTINLENMENVTITNPTNSQVLTFNGTEWVNSVLPSGSAECCDIIDSVVETENTNKTLRSAETKGAQCYMLFYGYPTDKSEELTYFWKLVDMSVFNFGA